MIIYDSFMIICVQRSEKKKLSLCVMKKIPIFAAEIYLENSNL